MLFRVVYYLELYYGVVVDSLFVGVVYWWCGELLLMWSCYSRVYFVECTSFILELFLCCVVVLLEVFVEMVFWRFFFFFFMGVVLFHI